MAGQDNIVLRRLVWHDTCGGCHSSLTPSGLVALSRESIRWVNLLNVYFKMTCKSVRWRIGVIGCALTGVYTNNNNNARTGAYYEKVLNPGNVNAGAKKTFGKLHTWEVEGQ